MKQKSIFRRVVDLSIPIKSLATPVYPGYPQPLKSTLTTIRDNGYNSNVWFFGEHTATHVDAPLHFVQNGKPIHELPISRCVNRGVVLNFSRKPPRYRIRKRDIAVRLVSARHKHDIGPGWTLLFYTGYTDKGGTPRWLDHPELTREACQFIAELKIDAIGFDAPAPDHAPFPAHKFLLPKGIIIFENLANLKELVGREFLFIAPPIPLMAGSAAPCRSIALVL